MCNSSGSFTQWGLPSVWRVTGTDSCCCRWVGAGVRDLSIPEPLFFQTYMNWMHVLVQKSSTYWFSSMQYLFSTMTVFIPVSENYKLFLLGIIRTGGSCVLQMEMGYEEADKIGIKVFVVKPWIIFHEPVVCALLASFTYMPSWVFLNQAILWGSICFGHQAADLL